MKKKTVFIAGVIMSVLIFGHCAQGGASVVANGSFEGDYAAVSPITEENLPLRWEDVDLLLGKFGGEVNTDYDYATGWPAHGDYSLILFPETYVRCFCTRRVNPSLSPRRQR